MKLSSSTSDISTLHSPILVRQLKALEKKRRLVENRMWLWTLAPLLWAIPVILSVVTQSSGLSVFAIIWIFVVLFGLGTYIHVILPSNDEISIAYKKLIIPELLTGAGIEADYSLSHGLKVDSFKKSCLYHDRYSHFERADSVIGKFKGVKFGLYELAVQVADSLGGTLPGTPSTSFLTNQFYGWVLHVPVRTLSGNIYIIPKTRKTKHESDDWLKATSDYFGREYADKIYRSGDAGFDNLFSVYVTSVAEAQNVLQPDFRNFLAAVLHESANAPAFSFVENRAYMHIGISDPGFEKKRGQLIYPPDTDALFKKIRFFSAITIALYVSASQKSAV